jgi:Bacterial protein of unknown function (DUF903)
MAAQRTWAHAALYSGPLANASCVRQGQPTAPWLAYTNLGGLHDSEDPFSHLRGRRRAGGLQLAAIRDEHQDRAMIITKRKPDLDTKTGMYSYEDSTGKKGTISKDDVGQIIER